LQKEEDEKESKELKEKMLNMGKFLSYEDDFDDTNFYIDNRKKNREANNGQKKRTQVEDEDESENSDDDDYMFGT
jgi:hypothetical protein